MTTSESDLDENGMAGAAHPLRRRWARAGSFVLWGLILSLATLNAWSSPNVLNLLTAAAFYLLFAIVHAQMYLVHWSGRRNFRKLDAKLRGAGYISEVGGLPNRNYLLAELRREMPRARGEETPFTLMVASLDTIDEIRERRGDDFADRALHGMVELLRRSTRNSDFLAHLGGARFCVLLVECDLGGAVTYLKRMPGSIPVSDGRHMYDVPLTARLAQYDMESLYATDVLAAVEEARPLRRQLRQGPDTRVA